MTLLMNSMESCTKQNGDYEPIVEMREAMEARLRATQDPKWEAGGVE